MTEKKNKERFDQETKIDLYLKKKLDETKPQCDYDIFSDTSKIYYSIWIPFEIKREEIKLIKDIPKGYFSLWKKDETINHNPKAIIPKMFVISEKMRSKKLATINSDIFHYLKGRMITDLRRIICRAHDRGYYAEKIYADSDGGKSIEIGEHIYYLDDNNISRFLEIAEDEKKHITTNETLYNDQNGNKNE